MFSGTKISTFNLTSWDTTKITASDNMFSSTPGTVGFSRTQADADKLNATVGKPAALIFGIPKNVKFIVDGTTVSNLTIATGNVIPAPTDPVKTGYTFMGWFTTTAATGGTQWTPSLTVSDNIVFYARWQIQQRTFTFNANNGTTPSPATITKDYGSTVGTLPTTSRTGYTFLGWFTATSGGTQLTTSTAMTSNTTYYAQWQIQTRTFTFNANGGNTPSPATITKDYGSTVGTLPTVTRAGYLLTGWFTATSGGTQLTTGTTMTTNTTYYAQWTPDSRTFTFNGNGGGTPNPVSITKPYNTAVGTLPTVSRTGYTLTGWFTATSGGTQLQTTTLITENRTYYAQWSINSYTVTFNANGGSGGTTKSVVYNTAVGTLPTPSRTGYTFNGWYTAASGGTAVSTSTVITGNVTYYAQWTVNNYTVTFNANGGVGGTTRSVAYGSAIGTLPTAQLDGHTFNGWYTATSGGTKIATTTTVTGNVTYYAQYSKNTYYVTYNSAGGSAVATTSFVFNSGGRISSAVPTRAGHTFSHWSYAGNNFAPGAAVPTGWGSFTLTANWTVNTYTVTFNGNGGTGSTSRTVSYGSAVGELPGSWISGHTHTGWYTAPSGGSKISASTIVYGNVTYYAQHSKNTYYVSYNSNGGTGVAQTSFVFDSGGRLSSTVPTRTGYTFSHWKHDSGSATFAPGAAVPTGWGSFGVVAQWNLNYYTVTFNPNGGSGGGTRSVGYGQALGTLPVPTRSGHKYFGWGGFAGIYNLNPNITSSTICYGNITYYAVWMKTSGKFTFESYSEVRTAPAGGSYVTYYDKGLSVSSISDVTLVGGNYWARYTRGSGGYGYVVIANINGTFRGYWN
jgi:uncharacterized repeat protein (TIGR02543 family)